MGILRRTLLWASTNPSMSQKLPRRRFVQRAVKRFMPGETLEDALTEAAALQGDGIPTIVTMLGENVETPDETLDTVAEYIEAIDLARARDLNLEVSIKPTHLGLDSDVQLAIDNISKLAKHAAPDGTLWIDMEGTEYTEATLDLYRAIRAEHVNIGLCLQSYLRSTADDLESLMALGPRIRLVKGAYMEPPELAFPDKSAVDESYLSLARRLFEHLAQGGDGFVGLGTHDSQMIEPLVETARASGLDQRHYEIEMLYGIRRREQARLVSRGIPVRVLISYGAAWFPWYMRRLAERPANLWFVLRSMAG